MSETTQKNIIKATEYTLPNGTAEEVDVGITHDQFNLVKELQEAGYTFSCEILRSNEAVAYLTDPVSEHDPIIEIFSVPQVEKYMDEIGDKYEGEIDRPFEYVFHRMIEHAHKAWLDCGRPKAGTQWRDTASA